MKKDRMFTPLNISYPIQKYSNALLIGVILALIIFVCGIIITFKVSNDMMFSPVFGSNLFKVIGVILSLWIALFVFRKIGLKEHELRRLYEEMIDHEITTINDLWDIIALDGPIATYQDDSCKIFIKCEKGYVVSRPPAHEEHHRKCFERFIGELFNRGYYVDYYNWHDRDGNTKPLEKLEEKLGSNPNNFLRNYGNSTIKFCRELSYSCTESEIEYFVVSCRDRNNAAYLESSVIAAVEHLQGSLYSDIRICEIDDIVEFLEEINKIQGININDMLTGNALKTNQKVVEILDIIGVVDDDDESIEEDNIEDNEELQEFIAIMEEANAIRRKRGFGNLLSRNSTKDIKSRPNNANNIIDMSSVPIPIDDIEDDIIDMTQSMPILVEEEKPNKKQKLPKLKKVDKNKSDENQIELNSDSLEINNKKSILSHNDIIEEASSVNPTESDDDFDLDSLFSDDVVESNDDEELLDDDGDELLDDDDDELLD